MRVLTRRGKRVGIRLEPETWAAIEMLAAKRGQKWQQWATAVLDAHPDALNVTGAIRVAAMNEMVEVMAAASGDFAPPPDVEHPLLNLVTAVNRSMFLRELADADVVYAVDLGAFVLHAGKRHVGGPALFIENKMIDQFSLILCEDE